MSMVAATSWLKRSIAVTSPLLQATQTWRVARATSAGPSLRPHASANVTTSAPVEGATVRLDGTSFYGTTNDTGFYSVTAAADATYQVTASAFGYGGGAESVYLPVDTTVPVDFTLEPAGAGTLQGTVTQLVSGVPLTGVRISFLNAPVDPVFTNESGFYQVDLPGGYGYDLKAEKTQYRPEEVLDVFVTEGQVTTHDFVLEAQNMPTGYLYGWVGDESNGDRLEGAEIRFMNAPLSPVYTNEEGRYEATVRGNYYYDLEAEKSGYGIGYAYSVFVPTDQNVKKNFGLEKDSCLFVAATAGAATEGELAAYREARSRLASDGDALARKILRLYRDHTAEVTAILLRSPLLRTEVRAMITRFMPVARAIADGAEFDQSLLSADDAEAIHALLEAVAVEGSARLRDGIASIRGDVDRLAGTGTRIESDKPIRR